MADDFTPFQKNVQRSLEKLVSKSELDPIAQEMAQIIKVRTRLGYGAKANGESKQKLAPLKDSTITSRKRKQKAGKLSNATAPSKSNLTESGAMLDSLKGRAVNQLIEIRPEGERNALVASYAQKGAKNRAPRPFLWLTKEDVRKLQAYMQDRFSQIVKSIFS